MKAVDIGAHVDLYDVPFVKMSLFGGDAVDHFVVDTDARAARKSAVPEKRGLCPAFFDIVSDYMIQLSGGDAVTHGFAGEEQSLAGDPACVTHFIDLFVIF